MEKINVVCVKWGSLYSSEYVNKLYSMVKRNLTIEFDFYCITEDASNIRPEVICIPCPKKSLENQWYKETMFLKGTIPERMTLYFDLDVVIVSSLDSLIPNDDKLWCMAEDFMNFKRDIPTYHGAVMCFNPKYWYSFYTFFEQEVINGLEMIRGQEQPLIARYHKYHNYRNLHVYPNEWIWSFRLGHTREEIGVYNQNYLLGYKIPKNGIVCSFHGFPSQHEYLQLEYINQDSIKWIEENWCETD